MPHNDNQTIPASPRERTGEWRIEQRMTLIVIAVLVAVCACLTGVSELLI